jgi:hypothetical protein
MYALIGGQGPTGDLLMAWLSPSIALGVVVLGCLLAFHIMIVRAVVRPMDGFGRIDTGRRRSGRRLTVGRSQIGDRGPTNWGNRSVDDTWTARQGWLEVGLIPDAARGRTGGPFENGRRRRR